MMWQAVHSTDTFAQLNKISITYGNNTKLMDEFDEHYLYQTALYNGLTDTTFADTGVLKSALEKAERIDHLGNETSRSRGVQRVRRDREKRKEKPSTFQKAG